MPPLRRLHTDQTLERGSSRWALEYWRQQPTVTILASLQPGGVESLQVKPDGRIMNDNTRIKVLEERGVDMHRLPRDILP